MLKKSFLILLLILGTINLAFGVDISACGTLNSGNTVYNVINNLTTTGTCITLNANNITLDCQGYTLDGDFSGTTDYGIYSSTRSDLKIKNCNIQNFTHGIYMVGASSGNNITNINITHSSQNGIRLVAITNSNFTNIISTHNNRGLHMYNGASNNIFTNTQFKDNNNYGISFGTTVNNNNQFLGSLIVRNNSGNYNIDLEYIGATAATNTYFSYINFSEGSYRNPDASNSVGSFDGGEINSCLTSGSWAGNITYTLINDINNQNGDCMTLQDGNILDCQGHTIDGDGDVTGYGININSVSNTTVKNCNVKEFGYGMYVYVSDGNNFLNINSTNNSYWGIYMIAGTNSNFTNVRFENNNDDGALIRGSHNNIFENLNIRNNGGNGFSLYTSVASNNNLIFESTMINNTGYDVVIPTGGGTGNSFYGNILSNSSKISTIAGNYWNYTVNGTGIGNLYNDFSGCGATTTLGIYTICTDTDYALVAGIFDYAPLSDIASGSGSTPNLSGTTSMRTIFPSFGTISIILTLTLIIGNFIF